MNVTIETLLKNSVPARADPVRVDGVKQGLNSTIETLLNTDLEEV